MAWNELLTTDIGLLSLFTIVFILVMGAYIYRYAVRKMDEDGKNAQGK
ncbi:DUF3149 domain-containing protein [Pseudothauera lacus]|uniref:DUF3149 domain-containing protein n=1 Tax=Pseudothauera lacus TaxID=2136175 RepID=A0A2T4IHI1_9RHOO|nr:DUF3149 domain-containing protein [Pseudothauera lacus]PTD97233.1 DUF3149 domain-containing protein [Pseudothauera lacus]